MTSEKSFLDSLKILSLGFPGNNVKWKLILLLIHHQSHVLQSSSSMGQNAVDQSNCRIQEKWMMKCNFGMQKNTKVFYKLILSFWMCIARHPQSTPNTEFEYLCDIYRKCGGGRWFFTCRNTHILTSFSITLGFTISLQYIKENMKDEVDFLPAGKHQRFLQIHIIILGVCDQTCPN